ncbi:MAG: hypothetical protein KC800_06980 [Candidatus Eremiobacteraeota bacterium]|nr:hypothetical protein [Candidatus Eremiobacteraeota bacterium]
MSYVGPARYEYYGKTIHLRLRKLKDLEQVLKLDEVFWLATTAPVGDYLLPPEFLKSLDTDGDGRVRVEELKAAIVWLRRSSKAEVPTSVLKRADIKSEKLLAGWDKIVKAFGLDSDAALTVQELRKLRARYVETPTEFGAGSLDPAEVEDAQERALLEAVKETVQPERETVTEEQLDTFLEDARRSLAWRDASPGENAWAAQYAAFRDLEEPLREYFLLADAARFTGEQPELGWPVGPVKERLREMPLAKPLQADGLYFESRVNPAYAKQVETFTATFLESGESVLSRSRYEELRERFETYADWLGQAPETRVKDFPTDELRRWLQEIDLLKSVRESLQEKREQGLVQRNFLDLEKLLLYQTHLLNFCQNFVAFPDLYDPKSRALFERGTLIMDGREFNLALPVDDIEVHKAAAVRSNMYVMYIQAQGETLAVPVTSGSKGNLAKGKRGVFHHVDGSEREARVVDLVSNPISLWEAMMAPFEKIGTAIRGKVEALSDEQEQALIDRATKVEKPKKEGVSGTVLAGGGVALAAISSSLAFVLKTLATLSPLRLFLGIFGLLFLCLAPAAVVAYLKLRSRDLSAVLEGNEWGINARMRLTTIQARQFTQHPRHPGYVGSSMSWILVIGLVVLAGCLAYFFRDEIVRIFMAV